MLDYLKNKLSDISSFNLRKKIEASQMESSPRDRLDRYDSIYRQDGWMNIITGMGVRGRDKNMATSYRMLCQISDAQLDQLYRGDGFVKRIIEIVSNEMIRQGWDIEGDADESVNQKIEQLNGYKTIIDLINWARLYGGAVIVMGIADGRNLEEPVDERNIRDICWLHVFDRYQAFSNDGTFEKDLNNPNYGYPNLYQVNDSRTGNIFVVHHSRVLRMDWCSLPPRLQNMNNGWGDSAIQSMYDELKNYSGAFANAGILLHDFVNGILTIPGLSEKVATECGDKQVMNRLNILNMAKSVANTMILDGEEKFEKITTQLSGLPELLDRFMQTLSAVCGIPVSLLFGRSAAGMNATGDNDVRNFYDLIKQYQEGKLKPCLERLVKYIFLSKEGPTRGLEPESWSIKFTPLWQNTEEQEALIRNKIAETDRIYIETGVLDPAEVAISRFGGDSYSANTEIDLEARRNGYSEEEIAEPEAEKQLEVEKEGPDPNIGPEFAPSHISYSRR